MRFFEQNFTRERVAIAVQAAGGNADQDIAGIDRRRIDNLFSLHNADDEAGKIVFAVRKVAGVLGRLTADQRAAGLTAASRDAAHDRFSDGHIELAANEVIQKKQRRRALGKNIIDAHGDEIDADGVVNAGHKGDLKLRTDTVGGRHQNRMTVAAPLQIE